MRDASARRLGGLTLSVTGGGKLHTASQRRRNVCKLHVERERTDILFLLIHSVIFNEIHFLCFRLNPFIIIINENQGSVLSTTSESLHLSFTVASDVSLENTAQRRAGHTVEPGNRPNHGGSWQRHTEATVAPWRGYYPLSFSSWSQSG